MIGDPSGRTDMRKMLTKEDIDHNAACFKRQMERFIDFGRRARCTRHRRANGRQGRHDA